MTFVHSYDFHLYESDESNRINDDCYHESDNAESLNPWNHESKVVLVWKDYFNFLLCQKEAAICLEDVVREDESDIDT